MSEAASSATRATGKNRRGYAFAPATAEQIAKGVGVTSKDAALVKKVLLQLGYLPERQAPRAKAGRPAAKKG